MWFAVWSLENCLRSPQEALRMFPAHFLVFSYIFSAAWCQVGLKVLYPGALSTTSGFCLLIPCQFNISKEKEPVLENSPEVTWRRGSLWSIYDTNKFTSVHRETEPVVEVVGDLRKKNCTSVMRNLTSLHSDNYYFRFNTSLYSVIETKAVRITVSDSLPEPKVTVPVLKEGEVVNLTCTVPVPCPSRLPNVTWAPALSGNITQETQLSADGTQSVSSVLNFIPSIHHHELKVNCVSIHPVDRENKPLLSHKTIVLNVEYPPKETSISLTGSVWLGNNLTLVCQSNANPPAVHRWFMKKEGVEEELGASRVLSFIASQENTGEYFCEAKNLQGAKNSTNLKINVTGISFAALLSVVALFALLIFAFLLLIIYRSMCKQPNSAETTQEENIYVNVSAIAAKNRELRSKPCGGEDIYTISTKSTFRYSNIDESIYANC